MCVSVMKRRTGRVRGTKMDHVPRELPFPFPVRGEGRLERSGMRIIGVWFCTSYVFHENEVGRAKRLLQWH